MNSSTDGEYIAHYLEYAAAGIFSIAGLTVQSFIIAMIISDRLKGGLMTAVDQIIFSLGLSRFVFHFLSLWRILYIAFFTTIPKILYIILTIIGNTSAFSNIWLSVLLSVVLTLKISTFHNGIILHLKLIILHRIMHLLAASVLLSLGCASFYFVMVNVIFVKHSENSTSDNISNEGENSANSVVIVWLLVFLVIYFLSTALLIIPLCLHLKRIKSDDNLTCRVDTYIKTITFIIMSFLMCAAYIIFTATNKFDINLSVAGMFIIWNVFPLSHSVFLIYAIAKLRSHFVQIFQQKNKCFFSR
uniref:Taste receptor type 2 n=2 Tax=Pyxicephalus adspersus TaxID=30357 RepID=A0AAV3AKF1_PYXAD|nr:TPA: hypothetical protein GDO54_009900 [Pyxicephalus adspersus]